MMQLISPTPMKAPRQARNASPSSERRTPGTAAIGPNLFNVGDSPDLSANYKNKECPIVANPAAIVQRSRVNLNDAAGQPIRGPFTSPRGPLGGWPPSQRVEFLNGWIRGRGRGSETAAGPNQPHDQQKDDGADRGID